MTQNNKGRDPGKDATPKTTKYSENFNMPALWRRSCTCRAWQPCRTCQTWRRLAFAVFGRRAGL